MLEATLKIGDPVTTTFGKYAPTVTVVAAEDRYLDGAHDRFPKNGVRASLTVSGPTATELELRFDTQDGRVVWYHSAASAVALAVPLSWADTYRLTSKYYV